MRIIFLSIFFSLFTTNLLFSQFEITNVDEFEYIKKGQTYVVVANPSAPENEQYKEMFKKYWGLTTVTFIKKEDRTDYQNENNSFFEFNYNTHTVNMKYNITDINDDRSLSSTYTYFWLEFWSIKHGTNSKIQLAKVEISPDYETYKKPESIQKVNIDGGGHIKNWGPGILKNYLQSILTGFSNSETRDLYSQVIHPNKTEFKKLKSDTLYVPDYILIKFGKYSGNENRHHSAKSLFKSYDYPYKVIPLAELNTKILRNESFFYLGYVKSCADKFVSVINSKTGDFVYSTFTKLSYNIESSDLKKISKIIEKD